MLTLFLVKSNGHADDCVFWFHDLPYLAQRIHFDSAIHNILSMVKEPSEPVSVAAGFELCGYDILDSDDSISVLTNCGGFPMFSHQLFQIVTLCSTAVQLPTISPVVSERLALTTSTVVTAACGLFADTQDAYNISTAFCG